MSLAIFPVKPKDKLIIKPCQRQDKEFDIVLQGTVYEREDEFIAVSFGGLLGKLPKEMDSVDDSIIIGIKKNKKRELVREDAGDAHKKKKHEKNRS